MQDLVGPAGLVLVHLEAHQPIKNIFRTYGVENI